MPDNLPCTISWISAAERPPLRCDLGSSVANSTPLFEAMPNPAVIDMPENEITDSTPSSCARMSAIRRITSSVRSSDAASGSCANAIR